MMSRRRLTVNNNVGRRIRRYSQQKKILFFICFIILFVMIQRLSSIKDLHHNHHHHYESAEEETSTSTTTELTTKVVERGGGGRKKGLLTSYDALLSNLKRKIKPICLIGPFFHQHQQHQQHHQQQKTTTSMSNTANNIISLAKAIRIVQKEGIGRKIALDKQWSDFYSSNFDNRHDILLNYDIGGRGRGRKSSNSNSGEYEYCHQTFNGGEQTFLINYYNNNKDDDDDLLIMASIISTLIPSKKIRSEAESILYRWEYGKRFISVHHHHQNLIINNNDNYYYKKSKEGCGGENNMNSMVARSTNSSRKNYYNATTTGDWCQLLDKLEACSQNIQYDTNSIPQVNPLDYPDGYPVIFFPDEDEVEDEESTTISDHHHHKSSSFQNINIFDNNNNNIQTTTTTKTSSPSNNYMVNMWLMTRSQIHYGNPQSNVDIIIAYWRNNKRPMEPSSCWNQLLLPYYYYQKTTTTHNDDDVDDIIIKPLCLRTPFFERTNNRIISLMKLLQLNKNEKKGRKLGLDEDWSIWYIEHFDPYDHHQEIILYYYDPLFPNSETCHRTYDGYESFHIKDWYYPILSKFVPRADYRYEADLIMQLWPPFFAAAKNNNNNWISVHRRNMEGLCLLFARCVDVDQTDWLTCHKERSKDKCSTKLRTKMCNMNYSMIEQHHHHHRYNTNHNTNNNNTSLLPAVVLFTDNQVPKLDNTFPNKFDTIFKSTSHIFVEMWLQTKSKSHWGNPQSTFDLTIKYWRKRGTMEPKVCWSWGK